VKLRPLSGRSTSSRPVTTRPSALVDVSTSCAPPVTVTASSIDESSIRTLTRTVWLTVTWIGCCTTVANFAAFAVRLYGPTGSSVNRKNPEASDVTSRVTPVSRCRAAR
jgi:hypothetical protein